MCRIMMLKTLLAGRESLLLRISPHHFSQPYPNQVQNVQQNMPWCNDFADCTSFLFNSGCDTFSDRMMINISCPPLHSSKSLLKDFWHLSGVQ